MQPRNHSVDEILAALATAANGVVSRQELDEAGISSQQIKTRLRKGSLRRVHPGVYRVGHEAASIEATYVAAVKACGPEAVLSGRAAGFLFGLLRGRTPRPEVMAKNQRRVDGVVTRRCSMLVPTEVTCWRSIPITTVARTVVDLARVMSEAELVRVCHEADVRHQVDPEAIEAVLDRRHNWPGARKLRAALRGDQPLTMSGLEARFLQVLAAARLPSPVTNRVAGGKRVDCRWPQYRLTVELDGYRFHRTRHAWEMDRQRERSARARGDEFRRYTYADVFEDSRSMLRDLRNLLAQPR